jgi:phosphoglycolate phosphatase
VSGKTSVPVEAVLFDLDGTFADTAGDLAYALNVLLEARGKPTLAPEQVRAVASSGSRGMLGVGFGIGPGDAQYEALVEEFLGVYEQNLCRETRLFPGIDALLEHIETRALKWGIVTNKAERFTLPLLRLLGLERRAGCVICGDTTPHRKPHPGPLLAAAERIGVAPTACIYLGDDERDMLAGRAAGMRVAVAEYGYLGLGSPPATWPADFRVRDPRELLSVLA